MPNLSGHSIIPVIINQTGVKAGNVNYTNGGRPRLVFITFLIPLASRAEYEFRNGGVAQSNMLHNNNTVDPQYVPYIGITPPGIIYRLNIGVGNTASISRWWEVDL